MPQRALPLSVIWYLHRNGQSNGSIASMQGPPRRHLQGFAQRCRLKISTLSDGSGTHNVCVLTWNLFLREATEKCESKCHLKQVTKRASRELNVRDGWTGCSRVTYSWIDMPPRYPSAQPYSDGESCKALKSDKSAEREGSPVAQPIFAEKKS